MKHQRSTFNRFPPKEQILEFTDTMNRRLKSPVSYLQYIMPVAEHFGDRVFEVAAQSLSASGVETTAQQLKAIAEELKTPEGKKKYARERTEHLIAITPLYYKGTEQD